MTKKTASLFITIAFIIIVIDILALSMEWIRLPFQKSIILGGVLFVIFSLSTLISNLMMQKNPESFVNGFLILTTLQMLSALAVVGALIYSKTFGYRGLSMQFISLFVGLLAVQSVLLILETRKSSTK